MRRSIESVIDQKYPNWELCIADDASTHQHVIKIINEYAEKEPRVKFMVRECNGHISAASNSALSLATGEYVALLDHDDEMVSYALKLIVKHINENPSAKIFYSDEDKIDKDGNRSCPHFKSGWNPDLLLSQNYIGHLVVYKHELLQSVGGLRLGVEGSQDHDLLLRCSRQVKDEDIVHVPQVLYHWRMIPGSTALDSASKSNYSIAAGIKALKDNSIDQGFNGIRIEEGSIPHSYRTYFPVPQPEPLVSLIIPTRDNLRYLEPCVKSILDKTKYNNYEIIILDNESVEPETLQYFERVQRENNKVRIIPYPYPFNFAAISNYGVSQAKGKLIGLVNNDIEVISPGWLNEMVSHALRTGVGCVGAKLYYSDNTIQHAGVITGIAGVAGHSHKYYSRRSLGYFARLKLVQNLSAVTAACLVIRKQLYEEVGGMEERLQVAFNDVDFCLKVKEAGYRNVWTPYAELYHHESKSRGYEDTKEKKQRFHSEVEFMKTKWGGILKQDPYYNPNLTLVREDFSLKIDEDNL